MTETTEDAFLGGRLRIRQPRRGYRAGIDPVLLAAAVRARRGESVIELGTGVGTALLCLMARVPGLAAVGVEKEPELARLAEKNATANGFDARIVECDLAELPGDLRAQSFDHAIMNPPFFDRSRGSAAQRPSREAGRGEETSLSIWSDTAIRRLKPGGYLTVIQRIERLPELLGSLDDRVGDLVVLPLAPRSGRPAKLFLLRARKGGRGNFRLLPAEVLHAGDRHVADGEDYAPRIRAVLRESAALELL